MDTLAEYTPASESLSSLMVFDKKAERRIAARRPVGEGFGLKRPEAPSDELDSRAAGQDQTTTRFYNVYCIMFLQLSIIYTSYKYSSLLCF